MCNAADMGMTTTSCSSYPLAQVSWQSSEGATRGDSADSFAQKRLRWSGLGCSATRLGRPTRLWHPCFSGGNGYNWLLCPTSYEQTLKRALSIGSSERDHRAEIDLLGERVEIERIGTNAMEAALVAAAGKGRPFTRDEIKEMLGRLKYEPSLEEF